MTSQRVLGLLTDPDGSQNPSMGSPSDTEDLLQKIRALPEDKIAEVVDFVSSLRARLGSAARQLEPAAQPAVDPAENVEAWAAWAASGRQGPLADDDEPE